MAGREVCITEVTSVLSRRPQSSQPSPSNNNPNIQETSNSYVSNQMTSLKRFSSTPALNHRRSLVGSHIQLNVACSPTSVQIPIVGYEVMEERARFTVYKLRISNPNFRDCWYVFRRYTDFVRLSTKLKAEFPKVKLSLPRKRWFGDNFDSRFIEQRIEGLQRFIDCISNDNELMNSHPVRQFFCLDQPPSYIEAGEENRAIFEALEETIYQLRRQLVEKEEECETLRSGLIMEQEKTNELILNIRRRSESCEKCGSFFEEVLDNFGSCMAHRDCRHHHRPERIFASSPCSSIDQEEM